MLYLSLSLSPIIIIIIIIIIITHRWGVEKGELEVEMWREETPAVATANIQIEDDIIGIFFKSNF